MFRLLIAPDDEVSNFYYKRRLATFNFTIYNMKNGEEICYVWNETITNTGANEIDTCLLDFIRSECNGTENNLSDIVFYSDNCSGKHKNKSIVSLYLYASLLLNINTICHKFLIVGHAQNEGVSMHSVIENQKQLVLRSSQSMYHLNGYLL